MEVDNVEFEFPAKSLISFKKLFESLEEMANSDEENTAKFAQHLIDELAPYSILKEGFEDPKMVEEYQPQIQKLCQMIFPAALATNEIKAVTAPFRFDFLHTSTRLSNILKDAGDSFELKMEKFGSDMYYIVGCATILGKYYKYPVNFSKPFIFDVESEKTGLKRFYKLAFNADLIEFIPTDKSVDITEEDFIQLINNFENIDLWKEKFPPNSWTMQGIGVLNFFDVTLDHSISMIAANLLAKTPETLDQIKENVKTLFGSNELEIGFIGKDGENFVQPNKQETMSILIENEHVVSCNNSLCEANYDQLINHRKPIVISDLDEYVKQGDSFIANTIHKKGFKSYIITPLIYEEEFIGFLEVASLKKHELNSFSVFKLDQITPIISVAAHRFAEDDMNKIEAVIQKECTTIHSSVKWKFEEQAHQYVENEFMGKEAHFDDIIFNDVYPLYGQMDIKSSSVLRNEAVVKDLKTQLVAVKDVLSKAFKTKKLPAFEELIFRIDQYIKELDHELMAGSEHKILGFLKSEIYPVFDHIKTLNKSLNKVVEEYLSKLNNDMDIIYDARKDFDESINKINNTLSSFIDQRQLEAQQMFPHYFERYKTDGIEYNIYIGQSIVKDETFDPLFLNNLRLWQLITMCEMENEFHLLQKDLKAPMEIASLILAYNTPLSIHFRMDEKRFDVEGAYNARYEIVKKRVDKAHIKGTNERVTVPGKIVIIYTNRHDEREYRTHFKFLESKGYLVPDSLEELELENLQGITGLKALRVTVNYLDRDEERSSLTFEELINSIEKK